MGFTKGNEGGGYTYMKIKGLTKDEAAPFFEVEGERIEDNKFVGTLINIETSSYEYEGKEKQTVKIGFVDEVGEKYQLDIAYNSISRNLFNSLLGFVRDNADVKEMKIEMSLYVNKGGFKSLGLLINGARANWFYSIEEQKELIERIENKKGELISNDYTEYDNKLRDGIETIKGVIGKKKQEVNEFGDLPF